MSNAASGAYSRGHDFGDLADMGHEYAEGEYAPRDAPLSAAAYAEGEYAPRARGPAQTAEDGAMLHEETVVCRSKNLRGRSITVRRV